ncbi:hypothetical protein ACOME3_000407 [Neoechinorhynchus agilis]
MHVQPYHQWLNELEGAANGCNFYKKEITSDAQAINERIRDMIAMYTPDDFVRRAALQDGQIDLEKLRSTAYNFEEMKTAPTLHTDDGGDNDSGSICWINKNG